MTPKPFRVSPQLRKSTISATTSWKEKLRRDCLIRIRNRQLHTPDKSRKVLALVSPSNKLFRDGEPFVRLLIEDEMRRNGIILESPCSWNHSESSYAQGGCEPMDTTCVLENELLPSVPVTSSTTYITEEELFDLSEEIELEIQREAANFMDEMIELEHQDLYDQVADFEKWQDSQNERHGALLCPICQRAYLDGASEQSIVCPNYMNGTCSMRLDDFKGLTSMDLQKRIERAFTEHSRCCGEILRVKVVSKNTSQSELIANCQTCFSEFVLL